MLLTYTATITVQQATAQSVSVNFSLFHDRLGSYGTWVNTPRYGQVWMYNEPGFKPYYSNGHWDYTDYGWSWISGYDWGWAPFHYGRWEFDDYYNNWIWIPGYEWAPAWVAWSEADDYYGWAPLGYGLDINISFGSIRQDRWVFAPRQYINSPRIRDYYIPASRNRIIFQNHITIINNNRYDSRDRFMRGPDRREAERFTRNRIEERKINDNDRFGRGDIARNEEHRRVEVREDNRQNRDIDRERTGGNREHSLEQARMDNRPGGNDRLPQRSDNNRPGNNDNGGMTQRRESSPDREYNSRENNTRTNRDQTNGADNRQAPVIMNKDRQTPATGTRPNNRQQPVSEPDIRNRRQQGNETPQREQNTYSDQPSPSGNRNNSQSQPGQRTQQQPPQRSFESRGPEQPSEGGDRPARRRG